MLALRNSAPAIAVLILVMAACIGFGVHQAVNLAVSSAIQRDGEVRINKLAAYINDRVPELEEIVKTGTPTPAQLQKLEVMRELGHVFLVKLFAPDGRLVLITGESSTPNGGDYIGRISAPAREAFQTGSNQLAVKNGKSEASRPDNYIQSYQRALGSNGQPVASRTLCRPDQYGRFPAGDLRLGCCRSGPVGRAGLSGPGICLHAKKC